MSSELGRALDQIADLVVARAAELNELDGFAGDGDLGITVINVAAAIHETLDAASGQSQDELLKAVGMGIARRAASTGGTLIATAFLRASGAEPAGSPLAQVAIAVRRGTDGIRGRGKAELGEKTMLDVLYPVCDELDAGVASGRALAEGLRHAAETARRAADATAELVPRRGRAGWLADRSAGHPDAGGKLVQFAFEAAAQVVAATEVEEK
jgi:dihydroxyacetone kinase